VLEVDACREEAKKDEELTFKIYLDLRVVVKVVPGGFMYARAMHNKHIKHDGVISNVNLDGRRRAGILIPRHRFRRRRPPSSDMHIISSSSSTMPCAGRCWCLLQSNA
jgi:hypothetical protein